MTCLNGVKVSGEYEKIEMKLGTYRVQRELGVLVCRGYYGDVTTLADNYWLVDNSQ